MKAFPGPLGRLRDPLLERDYVRLCSRPSFFRNRCLAALLAGMVVLLVYGVSAADDAPMDRMGRSVHLAFTWTAGLLALLAAVGEAAVAIPTERATNTLVVLLTVPLSTRRLAAGFLGSRLLFSLTGLLALLPIEGFALLLGGVSGTDLLLSAAAVGTAAVYGASVGMLAGNVAATHRVALGRSIAFLLFHVVLLPSLFGLAAALIETRWRGDPGMDGVQEVLGWCAGISVFSSPLGPLIVLSSGGLPIPYPVPGWVLHGGPALLAALLGLLSLRTAGNRLSLETESGIVAAGRTAKRSAAAGRAPGGVWRFPLLWKESRPAREWWKRWALRVSVGGLFLVLCWIFVDPKVQRNLANEDGGPGRRYWFYDAFISLPVWLLALGFLPLSATLVAEEREKQSFDLLRATPLSPAEWFLARPLGLVVKAWPFFAGMLLLTLYGVGAGIVHWLSPLCWAAGAILVLPGLALLGFRLGLKAPTVRAANRRAGFVLVFLVFGYPMTLGFLAALFRLNDDGLFLFGLNPFFAMSSPLVLLARAMDDSPDREVLVMGISGIVGGLLWFGLGALLWRRLPGMVRDAFHGKGAG